MIATIDSNVTTNKTVYKITIHFVLLFDTVLVIFADIKFVTFVDIVFVTFVDILSAMFKISFYTITEVFAIHCKYLPFSQIQRQGFKL